MESEDIYSQVCSAYTVQSDRKGFFAKFTEEVKSAVGDKYIQLYFGRLQTDQEKIISIFCDNEISQIAVPVLENVQPVFKQKDASFAIQRRLQAEKHYLAGEYSKSLLLINQSVMRAPHQGEMDNNKLILGLSIWTRSNILLKMGEGERAFNDLKLASIYGLDTKHNVDYYFQMSKAYALMGESARSKISLGVAENLVTDNTKKIAQMRKVVKETKPTYMNIVRIPEPKLGHGISSQLTDASELIRLAESKEQGKFMIATTDLKAGDIILAEKPVAACLLPDFYGCHCCHCFARLVTPVPCSKCAGTAFCSIECMKIATETYHKYECEYLDMFIGSGMSILCYIALRIFTQASSVDDGLKTANQLIENLCKHSEYRTPEDFLHRSLMAAFLLRCLQKSEYFGRQTTTAFQPNAKEIRVATALLSLLQLLQFNAHEIYETMRTEEHRFNGSKMLSIGAGIYQTGSYFNHNCNPTLARYFIGKTIVMACTRPVAMEESINENYGPVYTKFNLQDRQRTLNARYKFQCKCKACEENWPLLEDLDKSVRFKCPTRTCNNLIKCPENNTKNIRCTLCKKNVSMKDSLTEMANIADLYHQGATAMKEENTEKAIQYFSDGINLFHEIAVMPHKDTIIAQESLRICLSSNGSSFVKENVQI